MEAKRSVGRRGPRVPASVLYTPCLDADRLTKARLTPADVCLMDLEDSVPPDKKSFARDLCLDFLRGRPTSKATAVRINELRCNEGLVDLTALLGARVVPDIVVMTMVDSGVEVELVRTLLGRGGLFPQIYVTVETPASLDNLDGIARESDGMIFGSADLAASLGVEIDWDNMLYARQRIVAAASRYDIAAIDTGCYNMASAEELLGESRRAKRLGFHGKAAMHPSQLAAINGVFRVSEAELEWAQRVVDASERTGGGILVIDGNMTGPPFVRKARRILRLAGTAAEPESMP